MKKAWRYFKIGRQRVKIDSEDFDRVSSHTWRIRYRKETDKSSIITSVRTPKGPRNVSLGQFLMKPPKGKVVYPRRFFEGFDYRKENLIVCSVREKQMMFPKRRKDLSSSYRGVSYLKTANAWRASIKVHGRSINLGNFATEGKAALAYNQASKKYFGENGYQNTIRKSNKRR